jgi:hypothetical protein
MWTPIILEELKEALLLVKDRKASGIDEITAKFIKYGGLLLKLSVTLNKYVLVDLSNP